MAKWIKILSGIGVWIGLLVSAVLKWGGLLMDFLELPEAARTISNWSGTLRADDWAVLAIILFALILLLIIIRPNKSKPEQPAVHLPKTHKPFTAIKSTGGKDNIYEGNVLYGPGTVVELENEEGSIATSNVQIDPTKPIESPITKAVERDVWLLYAVHYIAYGSWTFIENPLDEDHLTAGHQALDEIRQKAFDKDLPVWGRIGQGPLFKQIQKEHWEDHSFKSLSFIVNKPEEFCTKYYGNESDYTIYNSLMTSKAKVEELWPTTKHLTHDQPTFNATRQELDKLFLAVVTVQTKVTNWESFDACKDTLVENVIFLREHEAIFEGSVYKQEYRDFMHAAGIAISTNKNYRDRDEMEYVKNLILESSKILEEFLR